VLDPLVQLCGCDYFLAGATARDLILVNVHGVQPGRATRDIDFGIAVESWAQFELLKARLLASGAFSASRAHQRLLFADPSEGISVPVDLIPSRSRVRRWGYCMAPEPGHRHECGWIRRGTGVLCGHRD
jgi:predicted nucleotidyltransferase